MKTSRILSVSLLAAGFMGATSASADGPYLYPYHGFAPESAETSKTTRAEVVADLREAQRLGLISTGEAGFRFAEPAAANAKPRIQVVAELREAQRLGLVSIGEGDVPISTAEQERLIAVAGLRAVEFSTMAKR